MSVVSHAIANIMKRVLVVLSLYMVGKRVATTFNFLGLAGCTLGLLIYVWDKQVRGAKKMPQAGGSLERLSKSFKMPWSYLLVVPCCLTCVWIGLSVFSPASPHSHNGAYLVRRFLELRESVKFQDEESASMFDSFSQHTFGPSSLRRPEDWKLAPNLNGYPANVSDGIKTFLNRPLIKNPEESSHLCKNLRTSMEVIREAQRIHYNMFTDAIGRFKYCILLDTADFENKGDPAILVGEMLFITRLGLKLVYYCSTVACKKDKLETAYSIASTYSPDELVVLLHGGGNINIYISHDILRGRIFEIFRGYQFFMFPQSVLQGNVSSSDFQRCIKLYCCNENLTFVLRDHQSHSIALEHFQGATRLLLAPDMAFHIGPVKRFMLPVFDILWIRRNDSEKPIYDNFPIHPPHLRLHVSDWFPFRTPGAGTSWEKSIYITVMGLFYTQRGRVVVTDRVHGHIFATLLDIPHVLLDNPARKLSSFHNSWTKGLENTRIAYSPEQAMQMALELLEIYGEHGLPQRAPWLNVSDTMDKINFTHPDNNFS